MVENNERQYNLDLLKAFAIICMVICHTVLMLGLYRPEYENEFLYTFADGIIGAYAVAAHGFMFAMGVGMVYSKKNSPGDQIRRGVSLFILGYVLNFFRYGMYFMTEGIITGIFPDRTMTSLFAGDILQFAGLAFIVTGVFKKLKLKETQMLFIALILSVIGSMAAFADTQNLVLNSLLGLFVLTPEHASTFCFCNWYLFVTVGLVFGKILKGTPDKDALYKKLLVISGIITAVYIATTCICGTWFLSKGNAYYDASPMEAFGLLAIDVFVLSLFHFLLTKMDVSKFRLGIEMSKNINTIYCIHWCIIGPIEFFFCHLLKWVPGYLEMYALGIVILIVSFLLAKHYKSWKEKFMGKYAI